MRAWRLTRAAYQQLDGEGARLYGGRWNSEGVAVVYLSSSLSLSALEHLAHIDIEDVPSDLVAVEVEILEYASIQEVDPATLPYDWNRVPDHTACVEAGDTWIAKGESLVLRVPSAVVPIESNLLLNPRHPGAGSARVVRSLPFGFDRRLLG